MLTRASDAIIGLLRGITVGFCNRGVSVEDQQDLVK
jgi:hypothetical protein